MKRLAFVLVLFGCNFGWAQVNLVPNPSFENYTTCPYNGGQAWSAEPWYNAYGGCDYFNECGTNGYDVPLNKIGWEYARTGRGYSQISAWSNLYPNAREFLGVELEDTLVASNNYLVSFFVSMPDSIWYAVKNVGIYLSKEQPVSNADSLLGKAPQIEYQGSNYLDNKVGWIKIEDIYVAEGGEKYLTIGNFDTDEKTDTLFVPDGGVFRPSQPDYWELSGYFIDDVSVVLDTTTSIKENGKLDFSVYPNPVDDELNIHLNTHTFIHKVALYDIQGKLVMEQNNFGSTHDISIALPYLFEGIYVLRITSNQDEMRKKIIITH